MNWKYILAVPNILQVFQQPFLLLFLQILEWNDKYESCSLDLSLLNNKSPVEPEELDNHPA